MQIKRAHLAIMIVVLLLSSVSANAYASTFPEHVLKAIKPKSSHPVEKLAVTSMNNGKEVKSFPDKIIIKNVGSNSVDNIRVLLSPEISKSFKLSERAIKSIEPKSNATVTFELNGSPNRDTMGNLVGYKGKLIVMAEHLRPIFLPINIGSQESSHVSSYMNNVVAMADQRYGKISLANSIVSKQPKMQYSYNVTTSDGNNVIDTLSDELVIRNLNEKELKNVRIYVSSAGHAFLLEQKNIRSLNASEQVSIKLIPKIDVKYSPRDVKGELLIIPANDSPFRVPINIVGEERKSRTDEFDVKTVSGNNTITTAVDKITIKNIANRTMDSVKIMMSDNLSRIFSLTEGSFQHIGAGEKVISELKLNAKDPRTFMQDYEGALTIMSEHHNMRSIPLSIKWNEISNEHFTIKVRTGNEPLAEQVLDTLESYYNNVTSRFGEMKSKALIYIVNNMDEMKLINDSGHPYYSYMDDVIFICSCNDVNGDALKEFVYRLIINKYPSYYNMKKFELDQENWLLDGVASYIAANITDTEPSKKYLDAFASNRTDFKWYGYGSDAQYGATHTFIEFMENKYGNNTIDIMLNHLASGMVSNHKCSAMEDCAVLRAVYDVSGLDMNEKKYALSFQNLIKEWEEYVKHT